MDTRTSLPRFALILLAMAAGFAMANSQSDETSPTVHPEVDPSIECHQCHEAFHEDLVLRWEKSAHGAVQVKCFVCHGDTRENFIKHPSRDRCLGCHAEQVASMGKGTLANTDDCFFCHLPHLLNPHALIPDSVDRAKEGADR